MKQQLPVRWGSKSETCMDTMSSQYVQDRGMKLASPKETPVIVKYDSSSTHTPVLVARTSISRGRPVGCLFGKTRTGARMGYERILKIRGRYVSFKRQGATVDPFYFASSCKTSFNCTLRYSEVENKIIVVSCTDIGKGEKIVLML